jgi:hypothetical protein
MPPRCFKPLKPRKASRVGGPRSSAGRQHVDLTIIEEPGWNMVVCIEMLGAGRMPSMHAGRLAELPEARIVATANAFSERPAQPSERTGATADADYQELGI